MAVHAPHAAFLIRWLGSVVAALVVTLLAVGGVFAQQPGARGASPAGGEFVPGQVLVAFKPSTGRLRALDALAQHGLRATGQVEALGVLEVAVAAGHELETVEFLRARPDVMYAEPNYLVHAADTTPNDPSYPLQWGLPRIGAPRAWDIIGPTGGAGVIIAIVDTGIDLSHPDFACPDKLTSGYDFVNDDPDPQDDDWRGHGTHVAGIGGACTNNTVGVAGVAWAVRLMPVKVLDSAGSGSYSNLANGIAYAADHGAGIINLSLGGVADSQIMSSAVQYAVSRGLLVVAAAGNCASGGSGCGGLVNPVMYPAAYPDVVAVAATSTDDSHAYFSEHHPYVDVSAPGMDIFSTVVGTYGSLSGTSMSTPFVCGLAALVWSVQSELPAGQVRALIEANADDLGTAGRDDYFGYGRINAGRTLQAQMTLRLAPAQLSFIVDSRAGPLPAEQPVEISTLSARSITWTATITPNVSWLRILPPGSGIASAAASGNVTLAATRPVTYGLYQATLIVTPLAPPAVVHPSQGGGDYGGAMASGTETIPTTSQITLHYVPQLYRQLLFPIAKDTEMP